jgi:hypothetical protein
MKKGYGEVCEKKIVFIIYEIGFLKTKARNASTNLRNKKDARLFYIALEIVGL